MGGQGKGLAKVCEACSSLGALGFLGMSHFFHSASSQHWSMVEPLLSAACDVKPALSWCREGSYCFTDRLGVIRPMGC